MGTTTEITKKKILHLTLKAEYFDDILSGKKKEEYREVKTFWIKRLTNQTEDGSFKGKQFYKDFDVIIFKNGYSKNPRQFTIEFKGIEQKTITHPVFNDDELGVFAIQLGEILETKNC